MYMYLLCISWFQIFNPHIRRSGGSTTRQPCPLRPGENDIPTIIPAAAQYRLVLRKKSHLRCHQYRHHHLRRHLLNLNQRITTLKSRAALGLDAALLLTRWQGPLFRIQPRVGSGWAFGPPRMDHSDVCPRAGSGWGIRPSLYRPLGCTEETRGKHVTQNEDGKFGNRTADFLGLNLQPTFNH